MHSIKELFGNWTFSPAEYFFITKPPGIEKSVKP
jgi:hypothetical protein